MKGTNEDESKSEEYCTYCFQNGKFTFDGSLEEFIEMQVKIVAEKMNIPEDKARKMGNAFLPKLKRWKK